MLEKLFPKDPVPHPETCECKGTNIVKRAGFDLACLGEKFSRKELTPEELARVQLLDEQQQRLERREYEAKAMRRRLYEMSLNRIVDTPPQKVGMNIPKTEEEAAGNIRTLCYTAYTVATIGTEVWFELEEVSNDEEQQKEEGEDKAQEETKPQDVP